MRRIALTLLLCAALLGTCFFGWFYSRSGQAYVKGLLPGDFVQCEAVTLSPWLSLSLLHPTFVDPQLGVIHADSASVQLSPWRLIKGQVGLRALQIEGIEFQGKLYKIHGEGIWRKENEWGIDARIGPTGETPLHVRIEQQPEKGKHSLMIAAHFPKDNFLVKGLPPVTLSSELDLQEDQLNFRWTTTAPQVEGCGSVDLKERTLNMQIHQQEHEISLEGRLKGKELELFVGTDRFAYTNTLLEAVAIKVRLELGQEQLSSRIQGAGYLNGKPLFARGIVTASKEKVSWNFGEIDFDAASLRLEGNFDLKEKALRCDAALWSGLGTVQTALSATFNKEGIKGRLDSLSGDVMSCHFEMADPIVWRKTAWGFATTPLILQVASGELYLAAHACEQEASIDLRLTDLPLTVIQAFDPTWSGTGTFSGRASLYDGEDGCHGKVDLDLEELEFRESDFEELGPLTAKLTLHILPDEWKLYSKLEGLDEQPAQLRLDLPITTSLKSPEVMLRMRDPIEGHLTGTGRLTPFLQPFVVDTTRIRGDLSLNLHLTGTPRTPELAGGLNLRNGRYESRYTGTVVDGINADILAQGQELVLERCEAHLGDGVIRASGRGVVDPWQGMPYELNVTLDHATVLQLDHLKGSGSGNLSLKGNIWRAKIKGGLTIDELIFHIPEQFPRSIPKLNVMFKGEEAPKEQIAKSRISYPVFLNVHLEAPKNAFIKGRGLTTEWAGELDLKGTLARPQTHGHFNVTRGEFVINGRPSPITHGLITMEGDPKAKTHLSLSSDVAVNDKTVLPITLAGPLSELEVLGLDGLSNIDVTLVAQILLQLTGGKVGPDVLGQIRRQTGLDLLDIGSEEVDSERQITLQIGKYFKRGFSISVQRTIARGQGKTAFDVGLSKEWRLRAELADRSEAQGEKRSRSQLSLKWKRDY